jgi:hypothetical protein
MKGRTGRPVIKSFLIGAVVGAVVALLWAPQPGSVTRSQLQAKSAEFRAWAAVTSTEVQHRAEALYRSAYSFLDEQKSKLDETSLVIIIFVVAAILALQFAKKKRYLEARGKQKRLSYYFYDNSLNFLIPLLSVILFYIVLYGVFQVASAYVNLQWLIKLDEFFTQLKASFKGLKPNAKQVFVAFFALYLLGQVGLPARISKKLFALVDKYKTFTKRAYMLLIFLCSFTLLGTQAGMPTDVLRLRIVTIREGYADLRDEAEEALSTEVANSLLEKVHDSFPPSYHAALALPAQTASKITVLERSYVAAQTEYEIRSSTTEEIIAKGLSRIESASGLDTSVEVGAEAQKTAWSSTPPESTEISYTRLARAREAVRRYRDRLRAEAIVFLETEGGKKLTLQVPKIATSEFKKALFQEWIESYPILEPFVDVFVKTVDKEVETRVASGVDRLVTTAMQNPESLEQVANEEASTIVQEKAVAVPDAALARANQEIAALQKEAEEIDEALAQLEAEVQRAEVKRTNRIISELRSADEEVVRKASEQLAEMGERLSEEQVDEIVSIMRSGNTQWPRALRREGHCTWYEYTTTEYYAGRSLLNMESQYVGQEIKAEAGRACDSGKYEEKVTDPGWI